MKKIYDETYTSGGQSSRNVWYSGCSLHQESEFVSIGNLSTAVQKLIVEQIRQDIRENGAGTETNWYFYDSITTEDANADKVRSSLMVKLMNKAFMTHINVSDHTFAVGFKTVQDQVSSLEEILNK